MAPRVHRRALSATALACGGIGLGLVIAALVRDVPEGPGAMRSASAAHGLERPAMRDVNEAAPPANLTPAAQGREGGMQSDARTGFPPTVERRLEPSPPPWPSGVLRSGRAIRGLQYSFLWSDDALEPPIGPPEPEQVARLARMPERIRQAVAAADEAVVRAERRKLEVEAQLGGSPLREAVFQLAVVDSLEAGYVVYPGRDIPLPASPEASLTHTLGPGRSRERSVRGWSRPSVERVRRFEIDQAGRRHRLVTRAIEVAVQEGPEAARKMAALWVAQGRAWYMEPAEAQDLAQLAQEWRRTREEHIQSVAGLLR